MTLFMIAMLVGLSGFLGLRLKLANTENTALRSQVASLKRQIVKLS